MFRSARQLLQATFLCCLLVNHVIGVPSTCNSGVFKIIDECVCPGYTAAVYKCTAVGSGFTQWGGSTFNCPNIGDEIFLSHNDFDDGIRKECNNGAIIGRSLQVNGTCYTSQLMVNISANLNGTTVECAYDSGSELETIGTTTLTIAADSLPPPKNVRLIDVQPKKLIFSWTPTASHCSAVAYEILSSCGGCPNATRSTLVTCAIESSQPRLCTFAVRSVICGDITGSWSNEIEVMLRVPAPPPFTKILSRYDAQILLALDVQFNHSYEDSFNISNGFDGSIIHHTVTFSDTVTGDTCASLVISPASCSNVCTSSLPLSCFPLNGVHNITVSVSASNKLGTGQYNSIIIDTTNQYVSVTTESVGTIICKFLNQEDVHKEKICSVLYGRCTQKFTRIAESSATYGSQISIPLHDTTESDLHNYCYAVSASYSTFSVLIEGNFSPSTGIKPFSDNCTVKVASISVILFLVSMIYIFHITLCIIWIYHRRSKGHKKDSESTPSITSKSGESFNCEYPMPSPAIQLSNLEDDFYAHVSFVLVHKPWKLLNALKIFQDKNIIDIRIMRPNERDRKIYILFEEDPSLEEVEYIYKNKLQEMNDAKVFEKPGKFVDPHDESGTEGHAVHKYEQKLPPKAGSLCKLLEGINKLSQQNSDYGLINITGITVKPSNDEDGSKDVELRFILELPTNWKEEFDKIKF